MSATRSSTKLKFIEEESDTEPALLSLENEKPDLALTAELDEVDQLETPVKATHRPTSPVTMSDEEGAAMNIIGEFLHGSSTKYGVSPSVVEEINEAASNGRASSDISKKVLEVVKRVNASGESSVEEDLGFVDGEVRLDSPIMKLLLTWAN